MKLNKKFIYCFDICVYNLLYMCCYMYIYTLTYIYVYIYIYMRLALLRLTTQVDVNVQHRTRVFYWFLFRVVLISMFILVHVFQQGTPAFFYLEKSEFKGLLHTHIYICIYVTFFTLYILHICIYLHVYIFF